MARTKTFMWNEREKRYVYKKARVEAYIKDQPSRFRELFPITKKTGQLSITKDVLGSIYDAKKYELDDNDYLQQVYRYLQVASALSGLTRRSVNEESQSRPFLHFYDDNEGVVRPYYNDYGSLTGRSQPPANSYLLAKPAWMRSLLCPPPGHAMVAADYGKQEVLYLAVVSQDKALINAYASGDVYLQFGLDSGYLREADKGTEKWIHGRQTCKTGLLGIMYGMGCLLYTSPSPRD